MTISYSWLPKDISYLDKHTQFNLKQLDELINGKFKGQFIVRWCPYMTDKPIDPEDIIVQIAVSCGARYYLNTSPLHTQYTDLWLSKLIEVYQAAILTVKGYDNYKFIHISESDGDEKMNALNKKYPLVFPMGL